MSELNIGDTVFVKSMNKEGKVVAVSQQDGTATVLITGSEGGEGGKPGQEGGEPTEGVEPTEGGEPTEGKPGQDGGSKPPPQPQKPQKRQSIDGKQQNPSTDINATLDDGSTYVDDAGNIFDDAGNIIGNINDKDLAEIFKPSIDVVPQLKDVVGLVDKGKKELPPDILKKLEEEGLEDVAGISDIDPDVLAELKRKEKQFVFVTTRDWRKKLTQLLQGVLHGIEEKYSANVMSRKREGQLGGTDEVPYAHTIAFIVDASGSFNYKEFKMALDLIEKFIRMHNLTNAVTYYLKVFSTNTSPRTFVKGAAWKNTLMRMFDKRKKQTDKKPSDMVGGNQDFGTWQHNVERKIAIEAELRNKELSDRQRELLKLEMDNLEIGPRPYVDGSGTVMDLPLQEFLRDVKKCECVIILSDFQVTNMHNRTGALLKRISMSYRTIYVQVSTSSYAVADGIKFLSKYDPKYYRQRLVQILKSD